MEKQLNHLKKIHKETAPEDILAIYEELPEECRRRIDDRGISDEVYRQKWMEEGFLKKDYQGSGEFVTDRGEHVRSKSEKIIADLLNRKGIPYRYEQELYLKGLGYVHLGFTILDVRKRKIIFLEHLGKMDDPEYAVENLKRITFYELNGYMLGDQLLITFETSETPLNTEALEKMIDHYFL